MTIWIVLLLLGAALSPLVWLLPSRRQRGRMDVRLAARRLGLGMQLAEQDWPYWLDPRPPQRCPQYYLPRRGRGTTTWQYWQMTPGVWVNQWREPCEDAEMLARLATLPTDLFKIEAGTQLVSAFWGERGGEAALEPIAAALKASV